MHMRRTEKTYGKKSGEGRVQEGWRTLCEAEQVNPVAVVACGGAVLLGGMMVRWICGPPWGSPAALQLGEHLPSVLGMTLVWRLWYAVLGAVFGAVTFSGRNTGVICLRTVESYRGGMCFVAMVLLGYLWYPLFFVSARFALATLLGLCITVLSCLSGLCYLRVCRMAGVLLLLHTAYLATLTLYGGLIVFGL